MNVHISYKIRKTPDIEKEVHHFLDKLQKRLQVFRPELIHLKGILEEGSPREGFAVSLNLRLPSGQMAAQKTGPAAAPAIKAAFDDLLHQVTKHKDLLRNSRHWARQRRGGNGRIEPQMPFENTFAAVQPLMVSAEDVRSYVNANLGRLRRFVERELIFREASEQISADSIAVEEVLDEAVACALGDGGEKPERVALEPWLYRLAIRAMDELGSGAVQSATAIHFEESARKQNVRASDEAELQFHQPDETLTEESVIADSSAATPEDLAYSDEIVRLVQAALRGASRPAREAFLLHTMEGFSIEEIAVITDRHPDQVRSSITAAQVHLRRNLPVRDTATPRIQRHTGIA